MANNDKRQRYFFELDDYELADMIVKMCGANNIEGTYNMDHGLISAVLEEKKKTKELIRKITLSERDPSDK
jgi:hypothetical protein